MYGINLPPIKVAKSMLTVTDEGDRPMSFVPTYFERYGRAYGRMHRPATRVPETQGLTYNALECPELTALKRLYTVGHHSSFTQLEKRIRRDAAVNFASRDLLEYYRSPKMESAAEKPRPKVSPLLKGLLARLEN